MYQVCTQFEYINLFIFFNFIRCCCCLLMFSRQCNNAIPQLIALILIHSATTYCCTECEWIYTSVQLKFNVQRCSRALFCIFITIIYFVAMYFARFNFQMETHIYINISIEIKFKTLTSIRVHISLNIMVIISHN